MSELSKEMKTFATAGFAKKCDYSFAKGGQFASVEVRPGNEGQNILFMQENNGKVTASYLFDRTPGWCIHVEGEPVYIKVGMPKDDDQNEIEGIIKKLLEINVIQ